MSERAQKILNWIQTQNLSELPIRQQTLADLLGCSRRSIGRALNELKQANLLVDLNKRHESRCKTYQVNQKGLTPQAQQLWNLYEKTFRIVFKMPELPDYFAKATWALEPITEESELWTKTWAGLWAITGQLPTEKVFDPQRKIWFYRIL